MKVKLVFLMKRKDGTSLEEFKHWLTREHVAFARKLPGVKRYIVNPLIEDDPNASCDAVTELFFDSRSAMDDAFATEAGKAAGKDVGAHCSTTSRLVCEENQLI